MPLEVKGTKNKGHFFTHKNNPMSDKKSIAYKKVKEKVHKKRKGRTLEDIYGKERAKEIKEKISKNNKSHLKSVQLKRRKTILKINNGKFPSAWNKGLKGYDKGFKMGAKNPMWKGGIWNMKHMCIKCNKEFYAPKHRKYCSRECQWNSEVWKNKQRKITKRNFIKNPNLTKKHSKLIKSMWRDKDSIYNNPKFLKSRMRIDKPNKVELQLLKLLKKTYPNEWKYVGNGLVWFGKKNPDFINCNGKKLIIELFGDYWHEKEDEANRIKHFKNYGFNTLVIWQSEMKNRNSVESKIHDFVKNRGDNYANGNKGKEIKIPSKETIERCSLSHT